MLIYCISLKSDIYRREVLKGRFPEVFPDFILIDAVDLRATKPQSCINQCRHNKYKLLSNAEIGCALSHIEAYKIFINSGEASALIIEDDIIGDDANLYFIEIIAKKLKDGDFMLCGGQEGLKGYKILQEKLIDSDSTYKIPKLFYRFYARTCCYVVTPSVAKELIKKQELCLDRADNWHRLLNKVKNFYYIDKLSHPENLSDSHIERARKKRSKIKNIIADGLTYTAFTQILKILSKLISLKVLG